MPSGSYPKLFQIKDISMANTYTPVYCSIVAIIETTIKESMNLVHKKCHYYQPIIAL